MWEQKSLFDSCKDSPLQKGKLDKCWSWMNSPGNKVDDKQPFYKHVDAFCEALQTSRPSKMSKLKNKMPLTGRLQTIMENQYKYPTRVPFVWVRFRGWKQELWGNSDCWKTQKYTVAEFFFGCKRQLWNSWFSLIFLGVLWGNSSK